MHPTVWAIVRNVILFLLGIVLILDSVFGDGSIDRVVELVVGLMLIGVIPLDVLLQRILPMPPPPKDKNDS